MATIKHTSSKNSDLTAPEHYLTFQHNEYTGLPPSGRERPAQAAGGVLTGHPGMQRAVLCHGLPAGKPEVQKELLSRRCEDSPIYYQLRPAGRCGQRTDLGKSPGSWPAVLQGKLSGSSRHCLRPPRRTQWSWQYPRSHCHRQRPNTDHPEAALYGKAL